MKPTRLTTRGQLDDRGERRADARWVLYVRPDGTDRHIVRSQRSSAERSVTGIGARLTFKPGTMVPLLSHTGGPDEVLLGKAPIEGAADFRTGDGTITTSPLLLISATPSIAVIGTTTVTTIAGAGFRASPVDVFRAVEWSSGINEFIASTLITVSVATFVSVNEVSVSVTVDAAVAEGTPINLEVVRGTA